MVGAHKKWAPMAPAFTQQHKLSSRRCAHRRKVEGSGKRDGSLQCGAACSTDSPVAMPFTRLLSTDAGVLRRRCEPIGQDRKGLSARPTDSSPHPDRFALIVVALAESPSMIDVVYPADGTLPRQEGQGDHPGSILSFDSGSAIKRITAGVKAAADRRCQVSIWGLAFTLPVKSVSNEKRILLSDRLRSRLCRWNAPMSVEQTDVVDIISIDRETGQVGSRIATVAWLRDGRLGTRRSPKNSKRRLLAFVEEQDVKQSLRARTGQCRRWCPGPPGRPRRTW